MNEPRHTYPSNYTPPTGSAAMDEAWQILDSVEPGVIPHDTRAYLVGLIAGTISRHARSKSA
jgi:hypothetical protein